MKTLGKNPEITRFKGLGEISPDEFKHFIADDIRLDPVKIDAHESIKEMLKFFMGKNTPERQQYIIRNLRYDVDIVEEEHQVNGSKGNLASKSLSSADVVNDGEAA
jgi:topoisomerase-4 subunit B